MKTKITIATVQDVLRATRKAQREEEFELYGPGFHAKNVAHKNKKRYTRKTKHKNREV